MNKLLSLILTIYLALFSSLAYSGLWESTKSVANNVADGVANTANKVGDTASDAVSGDELTPAQARKEIDNNAQKTLSRLFKESSAAKKRYDSSAGYAVFDSREFAFLIKTGVGAGVAVNKSDQSRVYMKMASGGLNIGGGIKYIQVIFLFPDKKILNKFINDGWGAEGDASAIGGSEGGHLGVTLPDGTTIYELTDTGIMLKMSISGTKYWKDSDLN